MAPRLAIAVALDAAFLVLFAALGRRTHDEGGGLAQTFEIAAPFLIAYVIAVVMVRLDRGPFDVGRGAVLAILTAVFGLILRKLAFDRGIAPAFMTVALITIAVLLVGWRLIASLVGRRSAQRRAPDG